MPLSYKAAWDAVDAMNNLADRPLVLRSTGGKNGGGTLLTEHGKKVVALYRALGDRTQLGFGIGTHLSNDVGLTPLNIVMKLTSANGQPVAKLSDSPGKTLCDDATFLAYLRQVFNVLAEAS